MQEPSPWRQRNRFSWTRPPPYYLSTVFLAIALTAGLFVFACVQPGERVELLVTVGSELEECGGVGPIKCLVVNGELFFDTIEGFDFEEGFYYRLKIERTDLYPGQDPPQDASRYRYRLLEVISKTTSPR